MKLRVGQILYGYCGGYFGRDSYQNKRVEAIGFDWVVAREVDSHEICFAETSGKDISKELSEYTEESQEGDI